MGQPLRTVLDALSAHGFDPRVTGPQDLTVTDVVYDSRQITGGELFVALRGAALDGHRYLGTAALRGASVVVVEADHGEIEWPADVGVPPTVVSVEGTREALAIIGAAYFGNPGKDLRIVGITGTNGKTTTTYILEAIARAAKIPCGMVGTVGYRYPGVVGKTVNTTPESVELHRLLAAMRDAGTDLVFLEVSSHALVTHRTGGVPFRVAMFTNLSQDHLNFHGTMSEYFAAKMRLFDDAVVERRGAVAVVNVGDPHGRRVIEHLPSDRQSVQYTALAGSTDMDVISAAAVTADVSGIDFELQGGPFAGLAIHSNLLGKINLENLVGAAACASVLGISDAAIAEGIATLARVPGRLELVEQGAEVDASSVVRPSVLVDYAHTPAAVAATVRSVSDMAGAGRTIVVAGCGGDRDVSKRRMMGAAAAEYADLVIATADNPRSEEPDEIIASQLEGITEAGAVPLDGRWRAGSGEKLYAAIASRREAIAVAVALAEQGDVVLVAGKGHETTQEQDGVRYPLSDIDEARQALRHPAGPPVVHCFSPADLAAACGGHLTGNADPLWRDRNAGITTDSRRVQEGSVFVALTGDRFDGHDFLESVVRAGAGTLIVSRQRASAALELFSGGLGAVIGVSDTVTALGDIAAAVLDKIRVRRPWFTTVAVTGSNGKTSAKEVLAAILSSWAGIAPHRVHRTPGNFNNFIGLPLTVFGLRWGTDVAILEMGTNAFGEVSRLVAIAKPEVRLLTSVGPAHLEGFGTYEGVLRAKAELFEDSGVQRATCIIPSALAPDLEAAGLLPGTGLELFGAETSAPHRVGLRNDGGMALNGTLGGATYHVGLVSPLVGRHNRSNVLGAFVAAAHAARRVGLEDLPHSGIVDLSGLELPGGRLDIQRGTGHFAGVDVLDDCYNANPASMKAGIDYLIEHAASGSRTYALLGDMFELGEGAAQHHLEVGEWAAAAGVDVVVGFGALAADITIGARKGSETLHILANGADDKAVDRLVEFLAGSVTPGDVVLIKGSRGMKMERIVAKLVGVDAD